MKSPKARYVPQFQCSRPLPGFGPVMWILKGQGGQDGQAFVRSIWHLASSIWQRTVLPRRHKDTKKKGGRSHRDHRGHRGGGSTDFADCTDKRRRGNLPQSTKDEMIHRLHRWTQINGDGGFTTKTRRKGGTGPLCVGNAMEFNRGLRGHRAAAR